MNEPHIEIKEFLETAFDLKSHLEKYLLLNSEQLESRLSTGLQNMALLHPGSFKIDAVNDFYENEVGNAHLLELASWHIGSADYIADTLRLQKMFAHGRVLDFGGGIGTHAIAAALMPDVTHVFFVDINPHNRDFVAQRASALGLDNLISVHKDIESTGNVQFDTLLCLDVLEHLPNPSSQLLTFRERLAPNSVAIMNWYFFKGNKGEYPFHFDDKELIEEFFLTLQQNFLEIFHPYLITTRAYKLLTDSRK